MNSPKRSEAYCLLGQYERAINDFNRSIELEPDNFVGYYNRGKAYQQLGDNAKAQTNFDKAKEFGYNG